MTARVLESTRFTVNQNLVMHLPYVITVVRRKKVESFDRRRRSMWKLSREYFRRESIWPFVVELLLFGLLVAISVWPMIDTVKALRLL